MRLKLFTLVGVVLLGACTTSEVVNINSNNTEYVVYDVHSGKYVLRDYYNPYRKKP